MFVHAKDISQAKKRFKIVLLQGKINTTLTKNRIMFGIDLRLRPNTPMSICMGIPQIPKRTSTMLTCLHFIVLEYDYIVTCFTIFTRYSLLNVGGPPSRTFGDYVIMSTTTKLGITV